MIEFIGSILLTLGIVIVLGAVLLCVDYQATIKLHEPEPWSPLEPTISPYENR